MQRALLLILGIAAITAFEFEVFPGHTYLQGDSQLLVPVLERLDTPGYLSRDLVATNPHVTYTIYDEVTLFLHAAGRLNFKTALLIQQISCRAAAVGGVLLLALSTGVSDGFALLIAALLNLGAALVGPAVLLTDPEPTPRAFAFGLILLAMGLLAREKPLLAGFIGGVALVYHVPTAAPFWAVLLAAYLFERRLRPLLRSALSILLVFCLLLANLAQLQPGALNPEPLFAKISAPLAQLQQFRTGYAWVSLWAGHEIWLYLGIWICGVWATARIWPTLNIQLRWLMLALPLCGICGVPLSFVLLERIRWILAPQLQPARTLVFTVAIASLACGLAAVRAISVRRFREALLWSLVVLAPPFASSFTLQRVTGPRTDNASNAAVSQIAAWAEDNTWGSSMFLFPDAGRELYPGIFRGESRRALWADWKSGAEAIYADSAAEEWFQRWRETMQPGFSKPRLQATLSLPIDYYVLKRAHRLSNVRPVFENREFVVYDANELNNAPWMRGMASPPITRPE
ncbi:MAG: hypothetical protein JO340_01970 [Acidobacteriaceae bacterium]|nr:hypothetical protein [Acidobacteriaceae bacterium]